MDITPLLPVILGHGLNILIILVLGWASLSLVRRLAPRLIRATLRRQALIDSPEEIKKREDTLISVTVWTSETALALIIGLMLLGELEINLAPAIAGLGVVSIALGFGAQALVRDIISGLFILLENQFRRGDVVKVAGVEGLVEEVNLRRTVLRDMDGIVHSVPNGEIRIASNYTREWSRVNLNITVSYETDIDRAAAVIDQVGRELAADPVLGPYVVEPPKFLRVEAFLESGVSLKVLGMTKPIRQWEVMGELRRRLLQAFVREGIEIPHARSAPAVPPPAVSAAPEPDPMPFPIAQSNPSND